MELDPTTTLAGKYRYECDLGAGGMGRVVVATHLVLRKRVALKLLTRTRSPEAVRRFLREARLAVRITSEHVTQVLDAGQLEDGVPYIAMELLDGMDLARIAKERGALPVAEACDYVHQACAGVGEAHALGMVHRDVKLANLFVVRTPRGPLVKVLDFGCAKAERVGTTSVAHPTADGAWLGTPRCMAPEQLVSSRDVDARTDVWALGVVLYTLLAGRPPFDGKTLRVLYEQIQQQSPPPIAQPLPYGLAAIIDRCLRKSPAERFTDARELAVALAPFAKAPGTRRARYIAIAAVALASTAIGASAVALELHRDRVATPPAPVASSAAPASSVSVVTASDAITVTTSESEPLRVIHAEPPRTAASVVSQVDDVKRRRATNTVNLEDVDAAKKVAKAFCARPHVKECFTWTTELCLEQAEGWNLACLSSSNTNACFSRLHRAQSQDSRVHSKACDDFAAD